MNVVKLGIVLGTLLLSARVGLAQEDQDEMKNNLLKKVEERLRAEEKRILKEISKIIDEELSGWKGGEKKTVVKPKKVTPAPKKKNSGSNEPGYLGVFPAELETEEMKSLGIRGGIILREIVANSPAEKAGLKEGDVVFNLNGNPIEDMDSFRDVILDMGAGSKMKVGFHRNGKKLWRTVTLGSRNEMEESAPPKKKEEFQRDRTEEELRKMTKKFLEEKRSERESQPEEQEPGRMPGLDLLALDEEAFESIRGMLEQFGMDPEQFFEQGEDGKWRPSGELMEMFKGFDMQKMFEQFRENMPEIPGLELPEEEMPSESTPREEPLLESPRKIEKKKAPVRKPGWIGIVPVELSEEETLKLNLDKGHGMVITEVVEGSPAERAKLEAGDVLTHINGKPLLGEEGLIEFVRASYAGQKATFTIHRDGKKKKLRIVLGERKN